MNIAAFGGLILALLYLAIPVLIIYEFVTFHRRTARQLDAIKEELITISRQLESRYKY